MSNPESAEPAVPLTPKQFEDYQRDGYVVIENILPSLEVDRLINRVQEYTHGDRQPGRLRIQMEPACARGELQVEHAGEAVRKIEGLVEHDDLFRKLGFHPTIMDVVQQILGPDIKMFRNALLLKPPRVGSAKCVHQDSPYWPIERMDLCSCWFALDDATLDNGCMHVLPGWQKKGPLEHVGEGDEFEIAPHLYEKSDLVPMPIPAGAGLFFHSLLPHWTAPNTSDRWRRAIALSYMSSRCRYVGEGESPKYLHGAGQTFPGCVC